MWAGGLKLCSNLQGLHSLSNFLWQGCRSNCVTLTLYCGLVGVDIQIYVNKYEWKKGWVIVMSSCFQHAHCGFCGESATVQVGRVGPLCLAIL